MGYSGFNGIDTIGLLQSPESGGWGPSEDLAAQTWPLIHFREPGLMGCLPIPGGALDRALDWLDESQVQDGVRQSDNNAVTREGRAYALFVPARTGQLNTPVIRSMHDNLVGKTAGGHRLFLWRSADAGATKAALALDDRHDTSRGSGSPNGGRLSSLCEASPLAPAHAPQARSNLSQR